MNTPEIVSLAVLVGLGGFGFGVIATHLIHYRGSTAPKPLKFIPDPSLKVMPDTSWKSNTSYSYTTVNGEERDMTEEEKEAFDKSMAEMKNSMQKMDDDLGESMKDLGETLENLFKR